MYSGQTWAGVSGLTAMHTTYVCNAGATCAPDATDFFRMDTDGMHYFGGTGANATGSQFSMMSYTSPEWLLKNPVTPGTMMGGGGYQNIGTWQVGVMGTGSMMGGQSYMSTYQALALETVSTPAGMFANALHVREQRGFEVTRDVWYAPGVGLVKMTDGTNAAVLAGYSIPGGASAPTGFTPVTGVWYDPNESGSGYGLDYQNGVLIVQVYSYLLGAPRSGTSAPGTSLTTCFRPRSTSTPEASASPAPTSRRRSSETTDRSPSRSPRGPPRTFCCPADTPDTSSGTSSPSHAVSACTSASASAATQAVSYTASS